MTYPKTHVDKKKNLIFKIFGKLLKIIRLISNTIFYYIYVVPTTNRCNFHVRNYFTVKMTKSLFKLYSLILTTK